MNRGIAMEIENGVLKSGSPKDNTTAVTIPDHVTTIGHGAFLGFHNLQTVTVPEGVKSIEQKAFIFCQNLQNITLPSSLRVIGKQCFCMCTSLKKIIIPNGVKEIKEEAFLQCSSLQNISIPRSVTTIGSAAFCMCSSLECITIPDSVQELDSLIVLSCDHLRHLYYGSAVLDVDNDYHMDNLNSDLHAANEMLRTLNFENDLPEQVKIPTVLSYCRNHSGNQLLAYLRKNAEKILSYLFEREDLDGANILLQKENVITDFNTMAQILDNSIQHSQNGGSPEFQMQLMRYANRFFPAETKHYRL